MSATHCCGPFSAATAALCTMEVGFEVHWLCSFAIALITARRRQSISQAPSRHRISLRERPQNHHALPILAQRSPPEKFRPV